MNLPTKTRVILDTDANNELDDQHAIAYLLLNGEHFAVEGITVNRTRNGGDIDEQHAEAERVVRLCGLPQQMPVYKGASGSFEEIRDHVHEADYDGAVAVDHIIARARAGSDRSLVLLPVGKLTNIALALHKAPDIADKVRIVWLGSNYPAPGEYNQVEDIPALQYILGLAVDFEIVLVRYGLPSGTDAVRATLADIENNVSGKGPRVDEPVTGRHGGAFHCFGDYSLNLFQHIRFHGDPPSRALFDMAAVAVVKHPGWATATRIPAPSLVDGKWVDQPGNPRQVTIWENFNSTAILQDLYRTLRDPIPAQP